MGTSERRRPRRPIVAILPQQSWSILAPFGGGRIRFVVDHVAIVGGRHIANGTVTSTGRKLQIDVRTLIRGLRGAKLESCA